MPPRTTPTETEEAELRLRLALPPDAPICGVDEAGRGPWAGPVAAAAVIFAPGAAPPGLFDSKTLAPARRTALDADIRAAGRVAVAFAEVEEIDAMGVGRATDLAMARAVAALLAAGPVAAALVDGRRAPPLGCPAEALVKGDGRSLAVAAAGIAAKVARDAVMDRLHAEHPRYGWSTNRGYGAPAHEAALQRWGLTPHHRRSFAPIHKIWLEDSAASR